MPSKVSVNIGNGEVLHNVIVTNAGLMPAGIVDPETLTGKGERSIFTVYHSMCEFPISETLLFFARRSARKSGT
jgi:hypothetical protein